MKTVTITLEEIENKADGTIAEMASVEYEGIDGRLDAFLCAYSLLKDLEHRTGSDISILCMEIEKFDSNDNAEIYKMKIDDMDTNSVDEIRAKGEKIK
jgi:hypothetical protein